MGLSVLFDNGHVDLQPGTVLMNQESHFLQTMPELKWPMEKLSRETTVFFVDLGPNGTSQNIYPNLHSVWTHCSQGSSRHCAQTITPWQAPGNYLRTANRYAF